MDFGPRGVPILIGTGTPATTKRGARPNVPGHGNVFHRDRGVRPGTGDIGRFSGTGSQTPRATAKSHGPTDPSFGTVAKPADYTTVLA